MTGVEGVRDKGVEWLVQLVTTVMLPSLEAELLIVGSMMLLQTITVRLATWCAILETHFPQAGMTPVEGGLASGGAANGWNPRHG